MSEIKIIKGNIQKKAPRKRVAAYARVSVDDDCSLHSFAAQVSYYSKLIRSNPEWEYAGVYADAGISGTKKANRNEFGRLICDCDSGKIDIIITKSISRFARNTLDLLETVRHLREIGTEVRFERENIRTTDEEGELMMTILASFAQEESRSISENIKWGIRKGFEYGRHNTFVLYGYRARNGKVEIVPEEAEVVRLIFSNYLAGLTMRDTEKQLAAMGVRSYYGGHFSRYAIYDILRQEKYTGNMLLQKYYIKDHISHKKMRNKGELPMYYVENSHNAIIDKKTFDRVQEEIKRRRELGIFANPVVRTNCFTSKIRCENCERNFRRYTKYQKNREPYKVWRCSVRNKYGASVCPSGDIPEAALKDACCLVLGMEDFDELSFGSSVEQINVSSDGELAFRFFDGNTVHILWRNTK